MVLLAVLFHCEAWESDGMPVHCPSHPKCVCSFFSYVEFCDAPGDGVQFYAIQEAVSHFLRQYAEEIVHAAGRFQDVACPKPHATHGFINRFDDRRVGVVRVEVEPLAAAYSFGISNSFSWAYSLLQPSFLGSKASARPPQPTYRERISGYSGVACPVVYSRYFSSLIAAILAWNLAFGLPSPR